MKQKKSIIPKQWAIPEIFRNRLGEEVGRQRLMNEEGQLLAVLHQVPNHELRGQREAALFWIDYEDQWKSMPERGGRTALQALVQTYADTVSKLTDTLDNSPNEEQVFSVIEQAAPILRASRNLLSVLQELRETLPEDSSVLSIRDLAIKVERSADLLMTDATATLDFQIASNAAKQAQEATKSAQEAQKLNRLAALFFPTVTLASIFGMNPPAEVIDDPNTFLVLVVGAVCGITLWLILKNSKC